MFCPNCGTEIKAAARFCPECGSALPQPAAVPAPEETAPEIVEAAPVVEEAAAPVIEETAPVIEEAAPVIEEAAPVIEEAAAPVATAERPAPAAPAAEQAAPPQKKGKTGLIIGIIAAVVVLAAAALIFLLPKKPAEIDLDKYIEVEYDGLDGRGTAYLSVDWESALKEIAQAKKLDYSALDLENDKIPEKWAGIIDLLSEKTELTVKETESRYMILEDGVYEGEHFAGLSNGDRFTAAVVCTDDEAAKKLGLSFPEEGQEFTVSGLSDIPEIDPFEDLEITVEGTSGDGYLDYEYVGSRDDIYSYMFDAEPWSELRNGDTVTVTFDYSEDSAQYYDFIPTRTEMVYTVEGLDEYLARFEDLNATALEAFQAKALEKIRENIGSFSACTVSEPEQCGWALATAPEMNYFDNNTLFLVYKAMITPDNALRVPFWAYYPVRFADVLNVEDALDRSYGSGYIPGSFTFILENYTYNYSDGYANPYALCAELRDGLDSGWSIVFGGEIADCDTGEDGVVRVRADFSDAAMEQIYACAIEQSKAQADADYDPEDYSFDDWACIGEYVIIDPEEDDPDYVTTLAVIVSAYGSYAPTGFEADIYFPVLFGGVYHTPDGVYIRDYEGVLTGSDGTSGGTDLAQIHGIFTDNLRENTNLTVEVCGDALLAYGD